MENPIVLVPGVGARIGERVLRLGATREEVLRIFGESDPSPAPGRDVIAGLGIVYEGDDARVSHIGAGANAVVEFGGRTIRPFDSAARALTALEKLAVVDDTYPEPGYSYAFPELELTLWRSLTPEEDRSRGRVFHAANIAPRGAISTGARVRAALRDERRHPEPPSGAWAEWKLIWPNNLGLAHFARFAADLREVPLPRMSLSLIGAKPASSYLSALEGCDSVTSMHLGVLNALDRLPKLPNLRRLDVSHGEYDSRFVASIAEARELRELRLGPAHVDDAALEGLAGLSSLRTLELSDAAITGASADVLAGLRALETLNLNRTHVDDRVCDALATLPNLRSVVLCYSRITEAGARRLAAAPSLRFLNVAYTSVADAVWRELHASVAARGKLAARAGSL